MKKHRRAVGWVALLCMVVMAGCTREFAEAMATAFLEGTLQSLPGVAAPGRYQVRLVSAKLARSDFASNDEPGAPELFVVVKHKGRTLLRTQDPTHIKQEKFQVVFTDVTFEVDWQRGDLIEVELWDQDIVAHDMLVRWVSTDADAPLIARRLVTQAGTEVVFTHNRTR